MSLKKHADIHHMGRIILIVLLCFGLFAGVVSAAATTSVEIQRIANDGSTVLKSETVTVDQMKADFPIQGDGITKYVHQGPIFEGTWEMAVEEDPDYADLPYDPYDPLEKLNFAKNKDGGPAAYRGTSVKDLASLVGGIPDDAKVGLRAPDGMERKFSASYINNPEPRMGPMVICWERDGSTTDEDLMRMYFFADDHVFGATDMLMTMPVQDRYNYSAVYPSARGLSVQNVNKIRIYTNEAVPTSTPTPTPTTTSTPTPTSTTTSTPTPTPTTTSTPTPTPTTTSTPTPTPTTTSTPTPTPTPTLAQPTVFAIKPAQTQASTPVPIIGVLAGLGAAAVFFAVRRK